MVHHYIGPLVWREPDEPGDDPGWEFIDPIGGIDLRSHSARAKAGGRPEGIGFHVTRDRLVNEPGYLNLGDSLERVQSQAELREIEQVLGLESGDLRGNSPTLLDVLKNALTLHGDPTGETRWKPLMPSKRRGKLRMEIHLPGHSMVLNEPFKLGEHQGSESVLALLREDYARMKRQDEGFLRRRALLRLKDWDHFKRWGGALERRFGVPIEVLVPGGKARPPRSRLADVFTDTDGVSLDAHTAVGDPDDGGFTWTEITGTELEIQSNRVQAVDAEAGTRARTDSGVSDDNHFVEIENSTDNKASANRKLMARYSPSANTHYAGVFKRVVSNGMRIREITAGTAATLSTLAESIGDLPVTLKIDINGSSLELFVDAVSKLTATDMSITGNLRGGLGMSVITGLGEFVSFTKFVLDDGIGAAPAVAARPPFFDPRRRRPL